MRHYSHKSMSDAKFESGTLSSFGDMTSQNFPLKKGNKSWNSGIYVSVNSSWVHPPRATPGD